MHTFILQDYTTIKGPASTNVTQNESGWLDLTPYQDLIFWTDVRQVTGGTVTFNFQTAPSKDESLFTNIITGIGIAAATVRAGQDKALMSSSTVPVARFLRWNLTGAPSAWDITFRIYVAANSPGM